MFAVFGSDCGIRLQHALAFAGQLQHRVLINREPATRVARDLGLEVSQTKGAVRLLKSLSYKPSPERLALVAMRDPGLDDADIAEMFGRSVAWARVVREQRSEIEAEEPVRLALEYLDDGLQPGDPMPEEVLSVAEELRLSGIYRAQKPRLRDYCNAAL